MNWRIAFVLGVASLTVVQVSHVEVGASPVAAIAEAGKKLASSDAVKSAAKTVAEKAADAADKTAPVEQTGGVRATLAHTASDLAVDKGLDLLGKKYPAVALAAPLAKKLAKPMLNKAHSSINNMFNKEEKAPAKEQADANDEKENQADKSANGGEKEAQAGEEKKNEQKDPNGGEKKEKKGLSKMTSLVKGEKEEDENVAKKDDKKEPSKVKADSDNDDGEEKDADGEGKKPKKGLLKKVTDLVKGEKDEKDDGENKEEEAKEKEEKVEGAKEGKKAKKDN